MKWIYAFFPLPFVFAQAALTEDALFALQQLRTVIPERLWEQEFSILVKDQAFLKQELKDSDGLYAVAPSRDYFLFSTMSGEPIRILDTYQEFEEGVFWKVPRMMDQLEEMER